MNRLLINTLYDNRYLLTEEILYNSANGEQIWAAQDRLQKQKVIGRFQADGQVEWFEDTRHATPKATRNNETTELGQQLNKSSRQTEQIELGQVSIPTNTPATKPAKNSRLFLYIGSVILILIIAGVYYQFFSVSKNSTNLVDIKPSEEKQLPAPIQNKNTEISQELINAKRLVSELNNLTQIPESKQSELFNEAKDVFTALTHNSENLAFIDSLMPIYRWNGVQAQIQYQKDNDIQFKNTAIAWYKLAYALKPNADLQMRFDYLEKPTQASNPEKISKPVTKKREDKKPTRSGFIKL